MVNYILTCSSCASVYIYGQDACYSEQRCPYCSQLNFGQRTKHVAYTGEQLEKYTGISKPASLKECRLIKCGTHKFLRVGGSIVKIATNVGGGEL